MSKIPSRPIIDQPVSTHTSHSLNSKNKKTESNNRVVEGKKRIPARVAPPPPEKKLQDRLITNHSENTQHAQQKQIVAKIKGALDSNDLSKLQKEKQLLQKSIQTSPLTTVEQMIVEEVAQNTVNHCMASKPKSDDDQTRLNFFTNIQRLYELTPEGMDEEAADDLQTELGNIASKYKVSPQNVTRLVQEIAKRIGVFANNEVARIQWKMTGVVESGRDGNAFTNSLKQCNTAEQLQKAVERWESTHEGLTPPEEEALQKVFVQVVGKDFFQTRVLQPKEHKSLVKSTASLVRSIVQSKENPDIMKHVLRNYSVGYPKLLVSMGLPSVRDGAMAAEHLDPLITQINESIEQQATERLVEQIKKLCEKKPPKAGKEQEFIAAKLDLASQRKIHHKDLMLEKKNKLEKADKETRGSILKAVDERVSDRFAAMEALVHQSTLKALGREQKYDR